MRLSTTFILLLSSIIATAQIQPIGQWKDHFPYSNGRSVAVAKNRVYVATGTGVFYYDKADNSVSTLSKVNGLSDVETKLVAYNASQNALCIAYENGNLDIIFNGNSIENFSDIKRATSILGEKTINNITFNGQFAYIATNFGIVVFDFEKKEFAETYIIGDNGTNLQVNQVAISNNTIYAATDVGIKRASLNDPFLNNFQNWQYLPNLVNGTNRVYKSIGIIDNTIFIGVGGPSGDTLKSSINGSAFTVVPGIEIFDIYNLNVSNGFVLVSNFNACRVYNANVQVVKDIEISDDFALRFKAGDLDTEGNLWTADAENGLAVSNGPLPYQKIKPDGPGSKISFASTYQNDKFYSVGGGSIGWSDLFAPFSVSQYNNASWQNLNRGSDPSLQAVSDPISIAIDPTNPNHKFYGTWGSGLIEEKNNEFTVYTFQNSPLTPFVQNDSLTYASGIGYDQDGLLWVANPYGTVNLHSIAPNGQWQSYDVGTALANKRVGPMLIDSYNQKWLALPIGGGLYVFKNNGNTIPFNQRRLLSNGTGVGNLPDNDVRCIVEDKDNQVWVGTGKGICIFFSPSQIFEGGVNAEAQIPGIVEGGFFFPLLENEVITAIAVDGANRKWIGTLRGGVFLVSPDGSRAVQEFNVDNSPLPSNTIISISINPKNGEVFIGTEEGLVSYRGDATDGSQGFGEVYAFPNPVRPNYTGPIAITGLADDVDVKIADIAGRVVFQTKAKGGTATWDGNNFAGERAKSGVYLVFSTNEDGSETNVTKIMMVN